MMEAQNNSTSVRPHESVLQNIDDSKNASYEEPSGTLHPKDYDSLSDDPLSLDVHTK